MTASYASVTTDPLTLLGDTDPAEFCDRAQSALDRLVEVMNNETVLLRAGKLADATALTAEKTRLAQDYVHAARAIQANAAAIRNAVPDAIERFRQGHAALATQLAENLKVLASTKSLTENLIGDVARRVGQNQAPSTYSNAGGRTAPPSASAKGLSVNRAL